MATYLLSWNPAEWDWKNLHSCIAQVKKKGYYRGSWSCAGTKSIQIHDRVFLIKLGKEEPRGIMAAGRVISDIYEDRHWNKKKTWTSYVNVEWDTILDPEVKIFPRTALEHDKFAAAHWSPQASGIRIPDEVAWQLEKDWADLLARSKRVEKAPLVEREAPPRTYLEGKRRQVTLSIYERNAKAREACIHHYGLDCSICGFNFEQVYGKLGEGFIEVHHL